MPKKQRVYRVHLAPQLVSADSVRDAKRKFLNSIEEPPDDDVGTWEAVENMIELIEPLKMRFL